MGFLDRFMKKEKDVTAEIISNLDCECLVVEEKGVRDIMNLYHQLLTQCRKEGFTPLIVVPSENMIEVVNGEYTSDTRDSILAKVARLDVKELLDRFLADVMPEEEDEEDDVAGEFSLAEEEANHFLSYEELVNKKFIIAKIPTDKPWEAAAWVPMGGFNECPMPEEQVALFRYWYEKYGAVPALVTTDVWEFYVEKPPITQEEAETLAWEQFGFCPDIVWQGIGTVNGLAGALIHSRYWYFWWD